VIAPAVTPPQPAALTPREAWKVLPDVWALLHPRRRVIAGGLTLVALNRTASLVFPSSTKRLVDDVLIHQHREMLGPIVLVVLGATLLQGLTGCALTHVLSRAALELTGDLRRRLQSHVGQLPLSFYDANKTGVLVSRIMHDAEATRALVGIGLIQVAGGVITALAAVVLLWRINALMTVVTIALLTVFALSLARAFRVMRPLMRVRPMLTGDVSGRLTEFMAGARVIKGFHAERQAEDIFASGMQRLLENGLKTLNATAVIGFGGSVFTGLVGSVVMFLGARQILGDHMEVGTYVMYTMLAGMLTAPVTQIVSLAPEMLEALAALERTREIMTEVREDDDVRRTHAMGRIRGGVVFDDVSFAYNGSRQVLHGIGFETVADRVTALVGPSGAGKSTIVALVAAFYGPTRGRILVDGVDLATVRLGSYRSQLGFVLQDTFLFDGTIRENVAFARPGAGDAAVRDACRLAHAEEFVRDLPDRYDTVIGERGVRLSGGQKQRLAIARAILADPRILILDEATSSVDGESEALIQEGLASLIGGRTTFVIAHRMSTIRHADQILLVERGQVVVRGTHDTLYAAGGRYRDLCAPQSARQPIESEPQVETRLITRS